MEKNKINIKIESYEEPERIFNVLKRWLIDNIQVFNLEIEGTELKHEQKHES